MDLNPYQPTHQGNVFPGDSLPIGKIEQIPKKTLINCLFLLYKNLKKKNNVSDSWSLPIFLLNFLMFQKSIWGRGYLKKIDNIELNKMIFLPLHGYHN